MFLAQFEKHAISTNFISKAVRSHTAKAGPQATMGRVSNIMAKHDHNDKLGRLGMWRKGMERATSNMKPESQKTLLSGLDRSAKAKANTLRGITSQPGLSQPLQAGPKATKAISANKGSTLDYSKMRPKSDAQMRQEAFKANQNRNTSAFSQNTLNASRMPNREYRGGNPQRAVNMAP